MSRTFRPRSAAVALAVGALVGALALTGCSAGQIAGTANQVDNSGGGDVTVGSIYVRNAQFVAEGEARGAGAFPAGGSAPLQARIVNEGSATDRLVSASSPVGRVQLSGTTDLPGGQVLVIEGRAAEQAPAEGDVTAEGVEPATVVEAPTAAGGERLAQVVLTGLTEPLRTGLTYQVVLVFEKAGEVRVDVPVTVATQPRVDSE